MIFDGKKINNSNFHKNKILFNIYDIEVDKILKTNSNTFLDIMMMMMMMMMTMRMMMMPKDLYV